MVVKFRRHVVAVFLLAASVVLTTGANVNAQGEKGITPAVSEKVLTQIKLLGQEKRSRTPIQRKISSQLLHAVKIRRGDSLLQGLPGLRSSVKIEADDTTLVDIQAVVTPALLEKIALLGGTVINSYPQYSAVRARLPLDALETLAAGSDVRAIRPASKPLLRKTNTSEGDVAHKADVARSTYSVSGSGVKVGVLSDSVDHLAVVQATGDLPGVTVLADPPDCSVYPCFSEGTAMLEIVHDLAPDAELYFATAWNGGPSFASNIQALADAGCDVIVDDVGYLEESPFQDDIISQAVNTVTSQGVLYFSSAGNGGNLNDGTSGVWEGDFSGLPGTTEINGDLYVVHDFGGGVGANKILFDSTGCYTLFWSDPLSASNNDYDLFLYDQSGDLAAGSNDVQDGTQNPFEGFCIPQDVSEYSLLVGKFSGEDRFLHLSANRGYLEHATAGQLAGHPAAVDAFAVAAVSAQGMATPFVGSESVETYSSDGPRRIFYLADGTALTPGNFLATGGTVRLKPDITAADCVSTATPGFSTFCGTSASAPHAAAIGALMLSANPGLTLPQVRQVFQDTAYDIEAVGWDRDSGYGILMADAALEAVAELPPPVDNEFPWTMFLPAVIKGAPLP